MTIPLITHCATHCSFLKVFYSCHSSYSKYLRALLKTLGVSSGQKCCCCHLRCWDAPRNVDSPENLAALAGVCGRQSGHPSLCLSGVVWLKGWAPLLPLNTPCMRLRRSLKCLECLLSIWPWLSVFIQSLGFIMFDRAAEKACCVLTTSCPVSGFLVWSTFAQMFDPFIFDLRQQQQQQDAQVSTVMSRTTTAGEQIKPASWPAAHSFYSKRIQKWVKIESGDSQMKVKMTKKAPNSIGLALGRPCSLSHILFRMLSVSSLASILVMWRHLQWKRSC